MLSGYLGAAGVEGSSVPAAAAARFVSLPLAAVTPLPPTSGSGAACKPPDEIGSSPSHQSGSRQSSLLLGDGAAAWLQGGRSAHCASPGSHMPDGGDGNSGGGSDGGSNGDSVLFFRTGDLGRVDAGSGLLVLGGRRDLQIKIRGVHIKTSRAHHAAAADPDDVSSTGSLAYAALLIVSTKNCARGTAVAASVQQRCV